MTLHFTKGYLWMLAGVTAADIIILFVRNAIADDNHYNFLLWNLFLALVPMLIALATHFVLDGRHPSRAIIWLGAALWLLFYPNAPYMISDLIHVAEVPGHIVLYDTMIIFLFTMLALFYGFFSLKLMQSLFVRISSPNVGRMFISASIIIASFGIYLGRILRLNSWDLFTRPLMVASEIFHHLFPVTKNPVTYAIVFLFSFIQFSMLACMKSLEAPVEADVRHKQ